MEGIRAVLVVLVVVLVVVDESQHCSPNPTGDHGDADDQTTARVNQPYVHGLLANCSFGRALVQIL